jgi:hypothetical protein
MGFDVATAGFGGPQILRPMGIGPLTSFGSPSVFNADRFGLPLCSSLLSETETQRVERVGAVITLVREVFSVTVRHLGDKLARDIWKEVAKGRAGRPRGRRKNPENDEMLLNVYDIDAATSDAKARRSLPRRLATAAHEQAPRHFGASAGAIEMHIRRLVKARRASAEADRGLAETRLRESRVPEGMVSGGFFDTAYDRAAGSTLRLTPAKNPLAGCSLERLVRATADKKSG